MLANAQRSTFLLHVLLLVGCRPELDDGAWLVDGPRLLAVRATPAEARPGEQVSLEALVVDARGVLADAPIAWARCDRRKPLAEPGTVASACIDGLGLSPFGSGPRATVTIPADACRLFGPDRPEPKPGEAAGRAADPDATGGYYQPVRASLSIGARAASVSMVDLRIRCGLAGATQEVVAEYGAKSKPNENPEITAWNETLITKAGAPVPLRSALAAGERYVWFDPVARALVEREEQLRVSWYATAGRFAEERTAAAENTWTAPTTPGVATLWLVVRDDRGGVAFRTATVTVE